MALTTTETLPASMVTNGLPEILIADAEVVTSHLLKGVFEREGYSVRTAQSDKALFAAIEDRIPDLIIIEPRLGRVSGFDILRRLREDPATAKIPTFLLTSATDWPDVLQGLELGADDSMRKPVHPRELLARAETKIRARRLELALQRRTRDLEVLLRISEVLNQHHDGEALVGLILSLMQDALPISAGALVNISRSTSSVAGIRINPAPVERRVSRWIASNLAQLDVSAIAVVAVVAEKWATQALVVPLNYLDDKEVASLLIGFSPEALDNQRIQLFEGLARQANLALRNAELYRIQMDYARHLEQKVEERTRELQSAQSQLIQAEKLASVGRLAAGIAHEINNPLLPIKINLEGILEDIQLRRPVEEDMVVTTLESVDRIKRLVQRLLEYNAGNQGDSETFVAVNLNEIAEAVLDLTRKSFAQAGKRIELDLHSVPPIEGNPDALTQIFINLALNANEAMSEGGVLTISTAAQGSTVTVAFRDTGAGIPEEMMDRLFDPFSTSKPGGSGLGLFVTYGIVQSHGGKIDVETHAGKGTVFTVTFPASRSR
ncbi:MAG: response regulator [Chloroflexi bacterium]|nr:response regulator [Chloroflexota bacterium]